MEAAMSRMSTRSSRHPAEDEGLNEMIYDPNVPLPQLPAEYEVATPKLESRQEEEEEKFEEVDPEKDYTLGLGVYFQDLSIVDEEMKREQEAEEEAEKLRQAEELAKASALELPESRPATRDENNSRPGTKQGAPQLSLLEVPLPDHRPARAG